MTFDEDVETKASQGLLRAGRSHMSVQLPVSDSGSAHTHPCWQDHSTGPCPTDSVQAINEVLTFIEVAEKRTLIVAKVGFDATSPQMCLASQWLI